MFAWVKHEVILKEVQKLLAVGIIKEINFSKWLSCPIVITKPGGAWRVFIDFTDLNKAIPKKTYSLPRYDQLVDSVPAMSCHFYMFTRETIKSL